MGPIRLLWVVSTYEEATLAAESQIGVCCRTDLKKQICFYPEQLDLFIAEL